MIMPKAWATLLIAVCVAGCATMKDEGPDASISYSGVTFQIQCPAAFKVAKEPRDGYFVYYFRIGESKTMFGIYEGQKPGLFSSKEKNLSLMRRGTTSRPGIEHGDDAWGVDSNGMFWRESLWSCFQINRDPVGKPFRVPIMLHLWYFGVTAEDQALFDSVIDTIQMKE
ncbi:MAG: hypothetical protein HY360_16565 [Verrucomicrobia bacterium]|nr:hypothetical protein [Verrucomicrobiota bacterium]